MGREELEQRTEVEAEDSSHNARVLLRKEQECGGSWKGLWGRSALPVGWARKYLSVFQ